MFNNTTDIISNDVFIEALRAPDGVRAFFQNDMSLPRSVCPVFAHETTHHWCFLSPIGATIALLRACSDIALYRAKLEHDVMAAVPRRIAADALSILYQPVAEGIALFSQFNMRASVKGLAVEPCEWVTQRFIKMPELLSEFQKILPSPTFQDIDKIPDELYLKYIEEINIFLDSRRMEEDQIKERLRLSMRSLSSNDGGYLSGYLLIKRAYNHILSDLEEFCDVNSFVAFAKEYFFHDTDLALNVLTAKAEGSDEITSRMNERLRLFDSKSIVELYHKYILLAAQTSRVPIAGRWKPTISEALDVRSGGDEAVSSAMESIMKREGAFPGEDGNEDNIDPVASTILMRIYGRDVFKLGTLNGVLSTKQLNLPTDNDLPYMGVFVPDAKYKMSSVILVPQVTKKRFNQTPASIDLLFWSSADRFVLATYVDIDLVGLSFNRDNLEPEIVTGFQALVEEQRALSKNIESIQEQAKVALDYVFADFEKDITSQIRAQLDQVLASRLFPNTSSPEVISSRLYDEGDRGLFKLYDTRHRPKQFAQLCAIVACNKTPALDEIDDVLDWSSRCETVTGWSMLAKSGEQFITAL